jgi:hypothetical protein
MTTFDDREKGFEKKYALDQEQLFRAHARRDKLFGLWVAAKLGLAGAEADAYAKSVVVEDLREPGDDDVLRKVTADLSAKGLKVAANDLTAKLAECMSTAAGQIKSEVK